jgi:F-type H+-transporting ATPase subunit b
LSFVSTSYAQTEAPAEQPAPTGHDAAPAGDAAAPDGHGAAPAGETHTGTEAHGGGHSTFPPFDPATFGSQIFWLVILFGLLYILMSRVALPRVGAILEERSAKIAGDLAEAERAKEASDAAIAAHEQALAEARQNAHGIAQKARDAGKAEIAADRTRIEKELNAKLAAAEAEIGKVKSRALLEVDTIARDAVETMVEVLVGTKVEKATVASAVEAAMAGRG